MLRRLALRRQRHPRLRAPLHFEGLEARCLPSASWADPTLVLVEISDNDTLDRAQDLGLLSADLPSLVNGWIGDGPAGPADVDWYSFELDRAAHVVLQTFTEPPGQLSSVLSLYNNDPDNFDDPYNPTFHRLLAQDDGAIRGGDAFLDVTLGPGVYFVAVSGSGNHAFHPFLADSGLEGSTGSYDLHLAATDLGLAPDDGPHVLGSDPAPESTVALSPFRIRIALSGPLDPETIRLDENVRLVFSPTGDFSDGQAQLLSLGSVAFAAAVNELQLAPAAPLAPGFYQVTLVGVATQDVPALLDPNGVPLGKDADHPDGADYILTFRVSDTADQADDTPATARELGDVTTAGLVQVGGAIGDDATDPLPFNGADVDMYHFRISGPGQFALIAEVFAGRIGSPLDPALSLFRAVPGGGLELVAANDDSRNPLVATNDSVPLASDATLFAGLTAGDYYLAVSGHENVPMPLSDPPILPGQEGVFDPNVSHSGLNGFSTGNYLLNLVVQPTSDPPAVTAVTIHEGEVLAAPPEHFQVTFDRPVNLQQLAFEAFEGTGTGALRGVFIEGPEEGNFSFPRLTHYDPVTSTAEFLLLDGLANGAYTLHLSGPLGLTDFGGNPLVGNDPSGDYVVHFVVNGPPRGSEGDPTTWPNQEGNDSTDGPQDLATLFPADLYDGVTIVRDATPGSADTEDNFRFNLLQGRTYFLSFDGPDLPEEVRLVLFDSAGNEIVSLAPGAPAMPLVLPQGAYLIHISGWSSDSAADTAYQVQLNLFDAPDNPMPLVVGPGPAVRLRLVTNTPPAPVADAPTPIVPAVSPATNPSGMTVTPAVTTTGSAPLPGVFTLPNSSLLVQNVSPLQGVATSGGRNNSTSANQVALTNSPPAALGTEVLPAALTVTVSDAGPAGTTDASAEAPPPAPPGDEDMPVSPEVQQIIDALFGLWGLFDMVPPPADAQDAEEEAEDGLEALSPAVEEEPSVAWVAACAVAGAVVTPLRWRREERRTEYSVLRTEN